MELLFACRSLVTNSEEKQLKYLYVYTFFLPKVLKNRQRSLRVKSFRTVGNERRATSDKMCHNFFVNK